MTAWMVVTVVSKSATSWLIETFMTDWSRTMMNWAPASATSGSSGSSASLVAASA